MAATAAVEEATDAGPAWNEITTARFNTADEHAPTTTNPIPIPTAGSNYSYWKTWRLKFTGSYTQITNVKIYTDGGGYGTGITTQVGDEVLTAGQYDQASGTSGTSGDYITNHTGITAATDIFTYTSGSEKTVDTSTISGDPGYSNLIIVQMGVTTTASQGTLSAETFTWIYDEI